MRIVIPTDDVPLRWVNNFCITTGCELDVSKEEIVLMEVTKR